MVGDSARHVSAGARTAWLPTGLQACALPLYSLAWILGYYVSTYYWFLPAGLRFAVLWCTPRHRWPWLALAELVAIAVVVVRGSGYDTWTGMFLGVVVPWSVHAGVIAFVSTDRRDRVPDTPWRMTRLLIAMLAAALLTATMLTWMKSIELSEASAEPIQNALAFVVGDMIAMLMLVPIAIHLTSPARAPVAPMLRELVLFFLPLLALVLLVPGLRPRASIYAALLALVPMVFMVFRHGWQGGGWALACTSVAVYALAESLESPVPRDIMQLFLVVLGAVTLMLGASVTALRHARDALSQRGDALAIQAEALQALSQRLVRGQEAAQRRIAQDLQGEIEQGVTALGTHLGLLARTRLEPAQMAAVDTLRGLTQDIHASMREVLLQLRPGMLDRLGLDQALRQGPIQDLLSDARVRCELSLRGDIAALDVDAQSAIYRICQETAIDCVRRARSPRIEIRLNVEALAGEVLRVSLLVRYQEPPARAAEITANPSHALGGTHDRVLALGGEYLVDAEAGSVCHRVHFDRSRSAKTAGAAPDS